MLAKDLRPMLAIRVLQTCYDLDGFHDRRTFDRADLMKLGTVDKLQNELPWIRAAYGVTVLSVLKRPIQSTRDAVKLLRQIVKVGSNGRYRLTYRTSGVRNFLPGEHRANSSRSIYCIERSDAALPTPAHISTRPVVRTEACA